MTPEPRFRYHRSYLIGPDGVVLYKGALGPFGFKPAELESALREHVPVASEEAPREF